MAVKQVFNTSAELDFPNVLPTLDLDFANSKTLDPRITFTRASGGSYVGADGLIKYAGVNEARFDHDPATGESLGLLIEESRQNLLTYSEDFGSGSWSKLNCSANTTNILSPSGSQSTNIFVPDQMQSNNLIAIVRNGVPVVSNNTYTLSLYIKNGGYNNLVLFVDNIKSSGPARTGALYRMTGTSGVSFSSSNLNTANVDTTHSIQKINNDWYKIFLTFPVETNSIGVNFRFTNDGVGYINTNGDGTSGIYIWGAQLEQGAFPTSYIPTQGSTRTRAVDNASITGKNFSDFINPEEGSLILDVIKNEFTEEGNAFIASLWATNTNYIGLDYGRIPNQVGPTYWVPENINAFTLQPPIQFPVKDNKLKYGISYSNNYLSISETNNLVTIGYPNRPKPTFNTLQFGRRSSGSFFKRKIHFRRLTYFPKALPSSQLQSLTS
jgi:hypothetical protein